MPNLNDKKFETELARQTKEGVRNLSELLEQKFERALAWSSEIGKHAKSKFEVTVHQKAQELEAFAKNLKTAQKGRYESLEEKRILDEHKFALNTMLQRFDLMLDVVRGESEQAESAMDVEQFLKLLDSFAQGMNAEVLWYGRFTEEFDLTTRLQGNTEVLSEADWPLVLKQVETVKSVRSDKKPNAAEATGMVLLGSLDKAQRHELMTRLSVEELARLVLDWVASGYVTRDVALSVLDARIAQIDPKKQKESKALLEAKKAELMGEKMDARLTQMEAASKETPKLHRRTFGHKNRARSLLSVKGIFSALLVANGSLTVVANGFSHLTSPGNMLENPALWLGVAQIGAGLELSKGFGGLAPVPSQKISGLFLERDEQEQDARAWQTERFTTELRNHVYELEFYVENIQKIVTAYADKRKKNPVTKIDLSLEEIFEGDEAGLKSARAWLADKGRSDGPLEEILSSWADQFYRSANNGMGKKSADAQLEFINAMRAEIPLPPFTR